LRPKACQKSSLAIEVTPFTEQIHSSGHLEASVVLDIEEIVPKKKGIEGKRGFSYQ
jgi:hypothetical protein